MGKYNMTEAIQNIPQNPGIYMMLDDQGQVIYVGKAKNLKKRVSSYFSSTAKDPKTHVLVKHIKNIEYIVTNSEFEALILECNLIKEKKPKYNIQLKDNKTYPFIKITVNEPYPRIFKTRHFRRDGAKYFGPYTNVGLIYKNLKMIQELFPIRSCKQKLPSKKKNPQPCLNYFIERCSGPCINKISSEEYQQHIDEVILFLSGKYAKLISQLTAKMKQAAQELKFELAGKIKSQIEAVKEINEKQSVYSTEAFDVDVIGYYHGENVIALLIMFIREGKILGKRLFVIKEEDVYQNFTPEVVIAEALKKYYNEDNEIPDEINLPALSDTSAHEFTLLAELFSKIKKKKVKINYPKIGRKSEWLALASQNAKFGYLEEQKMTQKELVLIELKQKLNLASEPRRIEGFDVANTLGENSVVAMVSFNNGLADKKNYRHYKVKSVEGSNDVASIQEGVARRYQRLMNESRTFPDLILIDGGKGQVNGAKEILDTLGLSIPIIGLAKRDEEVFFPKNSIPLIMPKNSSALRLLQEVRDEAHRFGNTFHKKLRKKKMLKSLFDDIKGVGRIRRKALLSHFKTIDDIKKASVEELSNVDKIDQPTAQKIYDFFH